MNKLLEILTTKLWMIMPEYVHGSRAMWEQNLNGRVAIDLQEKKKPFGMTIQDGTPAIRSYQVTEDGKARSRWYMDEMETPFVNVMPVDGPITRDGGACTYGSAELRDWLMQAANYDLCKAHVFFINSPGGSAWAINDFQQAIDYAHARNQRVYAFIDGLCASAAMYLASACDEVYYMHPKDQFGCIGVMAAFYTEKNGTYNQFTNETYHELYDPESYEKNKWYRDIANNSKDDKELIADLTRLGVEFRTAVQKAFPSAKDEHIHGKVFKAEEVKGILCDGQMTLGEVVVRAFEVANGTATPIVRVAPAPDEEEKPTEDETGNGEATTTNEDITSKSHINMKQYEKIATACGVEELVVNEEGAHFVPTMLDTLNQTLETQQTEKAAAEELIKGLRNQVAQAENEKNEAVAAKERELNEAHEKAINQLKADHATALQTEREAKETAEKSLKDVQEKLETANQTVADQKERIEALTGAPAAQHEKSPANNGQGAEVKEPTCGMPAYDHSKSPMENARIRKEYMAKLGQ